MTGVTQKQRGAGNEVGGAVGTGQCRASTVAETWAPLSSPVMGNGSVCILSSGTAPVKTVFWLLGLEQTKRSWGRSWENQLELP